MFQGLESEGSRAGSRAMKPPGGEASNLFGSPEEAAPSSRPNRMASNIFGPTEEPQNIPKRTNPPGGKGSGIFDESTPVQTRQRLNPPGGKTSDIFGSPVAATSPSAHPNKPKEYIKNFRNSATERQSDSKMGKGLDWTFPPKKIYKTTCSCAKEKTQSRPLKPQPAPRQEKSWGRRAALETQAAPSSLCPMPTADSHEPRLGPRPRSHNKVLNPPGGKSSISFY